MLRQVVVLIWAVMLFFPTHLIAQRSGGRGGRGAGTRSSGSGAANQDDSQEMKDFRRAIALQASPEQIAQFKVLSKNTQQATELAQNLHQLAATNGGNYSGQEASLRIAIEDTRTGMDEFVKSLSTAQESELKKLTRNLRKSDSNANKVWTNLGQELRRSKIDDKKIAAGTEHLHKILERLQRDQSAMAKEMSIAE